MNLPSLLGSLRKKTFAATAVRPARRRPRLTVQTLEERAVPATLPAPTIVANSYKAIDGNDVFAGDGSGGAFSPATAADPNDPNQMVTAYVFYSDKPRTQTAISIQYSTNGGKQWLLMDSPTLQLDPKATTNPNNPIEYTQVSDPAVAFDNFGFAYLTYTEHNTDNTAGRLILRKYKLATASEVDVSHGSTGNDEVGTWNGSGAEHVIYQWGDSAATTDPVYNPTIAIDNNLGAYTDPTVATAKQADALAAAESTAANVRVFVAWNTNNVPPTNPIPQFNPNVIKMAVSRDAGTTFTPAVVVSDPDPFLGQNYSSTRELFSQPKIVFTQGRSTQTNPQGITFGHGGNMVVVFDDFNKTTVANQTLYADATHFTATNIPFSVEKSVNVHVPINDAMKNPSGSGNDIPVDTNYSIAISAGDLNGLTKINDISISVDLHTNDLKELRAELIAPNGATRILFNNATDAGGNNTGVGLQGGGTDLGLLHPIPNIGFDGWTVDTTFQDNAPRNITDPGATGSRVGIYSAEGGSLIAKFTALTPAQMTGNWILRITDFRNSGSPPPPSYITRASLKLSQNLPDGMSLDNLTGAGPPVISGGLAPGSIDGQSFTTANPASAVGVGPGISLAVNNTLGAFSPYQNRVYMAYSDGTNVLVKWSDNGGVTWSAQPTVVGAGFNPVLSVDQTTGTLGLAYYSATDWAPAGFPVTGDAAGIRTATIFTTSIDQPAFHPSGTPKGSLTFSAPQYVNPTEQEHNQVTSSILTFTPIPNNGLAVNIGAHGYGNNMGLVMNRGNVNLLYTGNLDHQGAYIRTQTMTIGAGPRILVGDEGPIVTDNSVNSDFPTPNGSVLTFNNTFAADGHRQFNGFVVTFDRVIDPATFTGADITVKYRSPTDDPVTGGTNYVGTYTITSLDSITDPITGTNYGSKRFLVKLDTPQSAIGTYSYTVGPIIADRVRARYFTFVDSSTVLSIPDGTYGPVGSNTGVTIPDAIGNLPGSVGFTPPGIPSPTTITANVTGNPLIGNLAVEVDITHTDVSNLGIQLETPTGQLIDLIRQADAPAGANFQGTTFQDGQTQSVSDDFSPHTGFYIPAGTLQVLRGYRVNGPWELVVTDYIPGDNGVINHWKLIVNPLTNQGPAGANASNSTGNLMDQNGNGLDGETVGTSTPSDVFAVPNPINGTPFQLPYDSTSLPIIIPGPYVLASRMPGQTASPDNLVRNTSANSIDIEFDRLMNSASITPADILSMTGPEGPVPLSSVTVVPITALNGTPLLNPSTNSQFYRITFPMQILSGYYQIQLSSQVQDAAGNLLDTNHNAGVANLSGASVGSPVTTRTYDAGPLNTAIPANGSVVVPLTVNEAYQIARATVTIGLTLNGSAPAANTKNLDITLVAPDGKTVLLSTGAPETGNATSMVNTTFDDNSATPVQLGGTFDNASFDPIQPLAQLKTHGSNGVWKLVVKNKGTIGGTVSGFTLHFDKPVLGTGLGEPVADQQSLAFRIFQTDGSTTTAKANWTPVGPNGETAPYPVPTPDGLQPVTGPIKSTTVGRVQQVAIDPVDPSGNTAYAAGASGGVWRTTNFLTSDPLGPTWVPLTDFGPQNAINVGSIALYPDPNGNPLKTAILVGTGNEDANRQQKQQTLGTQNFRFDGVGFLLSEDAGKTWQVLDSSVNVDLTTGQYLPIVAPGPTLSIQTATENGSTVTITTTTNYGFRVGEMVTIAGDSVAGYNGTWTITGVNAATNSFTYTNTATGLGNGTGGTVQVVDLRDHKFVGADVKKLVFEDNKNAFSPFRSIIYAVVGQGVTPAANNVAGLYRSLDGGWTWTQIYQGNVSDFTLVRDSQFPNSGGRPTIGFMAVEGDGVYRTVHLNSSIPTFTKMAGGVGRPTINASFGGTQVLAPADSPNGAKGKIVLAVPAPIPNDPLANSFYQRWVYAAVSNADGSFNGLYQSKDAGDNWTRIVGPSATDPTFLTFGGGNWGLGLAIDPNNPNITYLGSDTVLRVDATFANDAYNFEQYQYNLADGGLIRSKSTGGVTVTQAARIDDAGQNPLAENGLLQPNPTTSSSVFDSLTPLSYLPGAIYQAGGASIPQNLKVPGGGYQTIQGLDALLQQDPRQTWNFINLERDPYDPFRTDTPLNTTGTGNGGNVQPAIQNFTNTGANTNVQISVVDPTDGTMPTKDFDWVASMTSFVDPVTGQARMVFGSDQGIYSFLNQADGSIVNVNGFEGNNLSVQGNRDGNIQVAQLYSGAVQPSQLAANISQSLLAAAGRRQMDIPMSDSGTMSNGNTVFGEMGPRGGPAQAVATDQTGSGITYILRAFDDPEAAGVDLNKANAFQVQVNGRYPHSETSGLFDLGFAQWDNSVRVFAVNPIDPNGVIMGSAKGRLYRTTNPVSTGLFWFDIGNSDLSSAGVLDGSLLTAMAFGSPDVTTTALDDFIYVGTQKGKVFVTETGGGTNSNPSNPNWINISAGLDGAEVEKIIPNPARGSHEAYAITATGVFHLQDWTQTGTPAATWVNITGNLKTIQALGFGSNNWSTTLVGLGLQTQQLLSMAVDWRPTYAPVPAAPILYVGGDAGVFRATINTTDATKTLWENFPTAKDGAVSDGGGMPVVKITDLSLSVGDLDPNSGRVIAAAAQDLLIATTLGRGMWSINLGAPAGVPGPRIISATPSTPQTTPVPKVTVTFNEFIDATTFTTADVKVTDSNGNPIAVSAVNDVTPVPPPGQPNLHNVWDIVFASPLATDGTYTIVVGPNITDGGGTPMDQDSDGVNGASDDAFTMKLIIGRNDVTDFVDDSFSKLLGRLPTVAEYTGAANTPVGANVFGKDIPNVVATQYTALQTILKELLGTYNSFEARDRLVERLFSNGNAAGEIGNLLPAPGYVLSTSERDTLVSALKSGTKSPESIITYILTKPEYFTAAGGTASGFVHKVYLDLFKGTNVTFDELAANVQATQLNQASTDSGRTTLVKSLVAGANVTYTVAGVTKTTSFRINEVNLLYTKLLGRVPTAAEITAGKALIAKPLAANSLQGSEWLYWKILSSPEYFGLASNVQSDGLPDDGLHTDRSWIEGVIRDRYFRTPVAGKYSTSAERDTYSEKILAQVPFKNARVTLERAIVGSIEYRMLRITKTYQLVFGPTRLVTDTEMTAALNVVRLQSFTQLAANLLGSAEYYNAHSNPNHTVPVRNLEWATAVYNTLLGRAPIGTEAATLVSHISSNTPGGRASAALTVLNSTDHTNGQTFRDILITQAFNLVLSRPPTAAELTAYETFLKTNRWESLFTDIMAAGTAIIENPTLGRQFWEIKD